MGWEAASAALGAIVIAAAAGKAADRPGTVVALSVYGVTGRLAGPVATALVAAEGAIGIALLAGSRAAGFAAAALLALFTGAQAMALAAGRSGAPCGCFGSRGRLGRLSLARTAFGAGAALAIAIAAPGALPPALAAAAGVAGAVAGLVAFGRRPGGALDVAGEGPARGAHTPLADHLPPADGLRLAVFTSHGCGLCRRLRPALARLRATPGLDVHVLDEERDAQAWLAAGVPGSPYAVLLDGNGVVLAKGAVNTGRQLRSLLGQGPQPEGDRLERRGFIGTGARLAAGVAGAATVGRLVKPGEAEAYHFCGHIYTTDSCPHPTGLPRIDARGFPLRARDGHPVDDLGRPIDGEGRPLDRDGSLLTDPDGRPLPRATRTRVCTAAGREYRIPVRVDGAWYRCCGGTVRKLVDCCSVHSQRINGDRALRGYCYGKRKVFCVMYFQTKVPC